MKTWKKVSLSGTAILAALTLAACGSSSTSASKSGKVTITLGTWDTASGNTQTVEQQVVAGFEKANPNIKVNIQATPQNYDTKLQTQLAAGDAPDIFQLGDGDISTFAAKGVLADLTSYVKGSNGLNMSDFQSSIMDIGVVNGKYYTLPDNYSTFAVYINKDMFQKAGLALPTANWTWADFEKDAKALTLKSGNTVTQWGAYFPATDLRTYLPFMYDYGGDVLSTDGKTVTADSAGAIAGWEEYNKLMNTDKVAPGASAVAASNGADLFLSKKAAMNLTGVWPAASYTQANLNYEVVPIPAGPAGQFTGLDYSGIAMNAKTKNADAAWKFLQYWENEGSDIIAKGGSLTANTKANTAAKLSTNPGTAVFLQVADKIKMFPERYNQYFASTAGQDLENVRVAIGNGTGSVDVSSQLKAATKKAQTDLDAASKN